MIPASRSVCWSVTSSGTDRWAVHPPGVVMATSSRMWPHISAAGTMKFSVQPSVPRSVAYGGLARAVTLPGGSGASVPMVFHRNPNMRRRTVTVPVTPAMSPPNQPART